MSDKTNKLNICLIKDRYETFEDIVKPEAKSLEIEGVGTFYWANSHDNPPDWLEDFFGDDVADQVDVFNASSRGVLLVTIDYGKKKRTFAVLFGLGRHLLNEDVIEERFGLKVVLNSVDRNSLRSIDKTALGSVPKRSREQMSRESEAAGFGIDIEQDLVTAVTGRSDDARLGKTVSGKDTLAVSVKKDSAEIKEFLHVCMQKYMSKAYKAEFGWIDQISEVRDSRTLKRLDGWLQQRLEARQLEKIWMAPPSVVDWVDIKGFRYARKKQAELRLDLDVTEFLESLGEDAVPTVDLLRATTVFAISSKNEEATDHWTAYRCLYAEADIDGSIYILNNGKWYAIASGFTEQVLSSFAHFAESTLDLPAYDHADEGAYNDSLPNSIVGSCSMDRKVVPYGGGHSTIEFCDLLTTDKRLVHVKRYSGSAQLSHLFNQGIVAGELFVGDEAFRAELNEKLPETHKLPDMNRPVFSGGHFV